MAYRGGEWRSEKVLKIWQTLYVNGPNSNLIDPLNFKNAVYILYIKAKCHFYYFVLLFCFTILFYYFVLLFCSTDCVFLSLILLR